MKKIFIPFAAALLTLGFTACEDVPAPYEVNGDGGSQGGIVGNTILDEKFAQSLGSFSAINTLGDVSWTVKYGCAQISSFVDTDGDGVKENLPADSWLVSSQLNFADVEEAHISFDYILRYANAAEVKDNYQVLVSKDYKGFPAEAKWTALDLKLVQGSDWETWYKVDCDLPAEVMKQPQITLAIRYKADKKAATWEIKNLKVMRGKAETPETPETPQKPETPTGKNLIANSSFEIWTGGKPEAWTSTTTASSATLSQSADAHTGSAAVLVGGNASQNKRLASKEYTLKAGSYKMSLFVKGSGQVRPGYTIVGDDNKIASQGGYVYGEYTSTTADSWTEVTYSFELKEQTKVNFIMMNPKTTDYAAASDKLVDDFTVTTSNGGIVENGQGTTDPQPQPGGALLSESFAKGQGKFTIENKLLPAGADYIWKADTQYGYMKASAFINGESLESESWLVSPVVDLAPSANPTLTFEHVANKGDVSKMAEQNMLYVKAEGGEWTKMDITTYSPGNDWKAWTTSVQSLAAYKGKKIQFAFVYKTPKGSSGTWEVKNVEVK